MHGRTPPWEEELVCRHGVVSLMENVFITCWFSFRVPWWGFPEAEAGFPRKHVKQSPRVISALGTVWWAGTTAAGRNSPLSGCTHPTFGMDLTISGSWGASPMHSTLMATRPHSCECYRPPLPIAHAASTSPSVSWDWNGDICVKGCKNREPWSFDAEPVGTGLSVGPMPSSLTYMVLRMCHHNFRLWALQGREPFTASEALALKSIMISVLR